MNHKHFGLSIVIVAILALVAQQSASVFSYLGAGRVASSLNFINRAAAQGNAAPSRVQFASGGGNPAASAVITLPGASSADNELIVGIASSYAGKTFNVTDNANNVWHLATSISSGAGQMAAIFYAENINSTSTPKITVSPSASTYFVVTVAEYSGLVTSGSLDAVVTHVGASGNSAYNSGTLTTGGAGDLLFGAHEFYCGSTVPTPAAPFATVATKFLGTGNGWPTLQIQQALANSAGSFASQGTSTCSLSVNNNVLAAFKAAPSNGPLMPVVSSFTASPSTINLGGNSTLTWSVSGADSVSIDQGLGSQATSTGSVSVSPSLTTTYNLTASNSTGIATSSATVIVTAVPVDTSPPSVPTNLSASSSSVSQINLTWTASTDNVGVAGYQIYRGGVQIATTTNTSYSDIGLSPSTNYSYTVAAYDAAGNVSSQSTSASATTQAGSTSNTTITWTKMTSNSTWPHSVGWLTLPYDPLSQQTIVDTVTPAASGIYSTDIYTYDSASNNFTHVGGTGSIGDRCPNDLPNQPGDRHPEGQMAVDSRRHVMWLYGGVNDGCGVGNVNINGTQVNLLNIANGWTFPTDGSLVGQTLKFVGSANTYTVASVQDANDLTLTSSAGTQSNVQLIMTTGGDASPRKDTYYLSLNASPTSDTWHQVMPAHIPIAASVSSMVYDPDDDVLLAIGYDSGSASHDQWVYCPTDLNPTPGVLTAKQSAAGCLNPDDWSEINAGPIPMAAAGYLNLIYHPVLKKVILYGGASSGGIKENQTWFYDIPTHTWTQKCQGSCTPPPVSTDNIPVPAIVYNPTNQKLLYHQDSGVGAPADWEYDPVADTWTKLVSSGTAPAQNIVMSYDTKTNTLVGWYLGSGTTVWQGTVSVPPPADTTPPSIPTNLTATSASSSAISLSWTASTDDTGVIGYQIFRNGLQVATSTVLGYSDTGLAPSTTYSYTVAAFDAAGNVSGQSTAANGTTQAAASNGGTTVAWTSPTKNSTWPGYSADSVLMYDPYSGQTFYYGTLPTASGIYSTDAFFYNSKNNQWTHLGGTGSPTDNCNDGSASAVQPWPSDRHPSGQMAIDTTRHVLWLYGGVCDNTVPQDYIWKLSLNADPTQDRWTKLNLTTKPYMGNLFQFVYDSDDDVIYSYGFNSSLPQNWLYCPTDLNTIPGTLSAKQAAAGCLRADDWSQVTPVGITFTTQCGDHQPCGWMSPGLLYDAVTKKAILFGGLNAAAYQTQTWAYDIPTHTWTQKALSGPHPTSSPLGSTPYTTWAYNSNDHKIYYHDARLGADWQYDPAADQWAQIASTGGGTQTDQTMVYDTSSNSLVAWYQGQVANLPIWVGQLSTGTTTDTIAPSVPASIAAVASTTSVYLSWATSTDNVGVTGYLIYRGGVQIGTSTLANYSDTGLTPSTNYSYNVAAIDGAGNISSQSTAVGATTLSASSGSAIPPVISSIQTSSSTNSSVSISWSTDENSDSQVEYGLTNSYGTSSPLDSSLVTSHSVSLSGLTASTTYHFRVKSTDASGNQAVSSDNTFTTAPDLTGPIISFFSASSSTITIGDSGTLTWSVLGADSLSLDNGVGDVTNLPSVSVSPSTTTSYTLTAVSAFGTSTAVATIVVSTPPDVTPPIVSLEVQDSSGQPINAGATIDGNLTFNVSASDPSVSGQTTSGLASIILKLDGNALASSTSGTLSFSLDTHSLLNTSHTIVATAVDNAGNQASSQTFLLQEIGFLSGLQ